MKSHLRTPLVALAPVLFAACAAGDAGPHLQVAVAPLRLDGIVDAIYGIEVRTADGDLVFAQTGLSSTGYGDGHGALTYIGTCVAQAGANPHRVTLTLEKLLGPDGELDDPEDFRNPTPVTRADVICQENADTLVQFDLTIARSANQGFFDVAVNFEDIFCSAKVDCREAFLHNDQGERAETAVMAFACTSGANEPTWMYMSQVAVSCTFPDGHKETYDIPIGQVGQFDAIPPNRGIFGVGVYQGDEQLEPYDKCYLNTAIGLDLEALTVDGVTASCTLSATATASSAHWDDLTSPTDAYYPYVDFEVPLTHPNGSLCKANPLDGIGSQVRTRYTVAPDGTFAPRTFGRAFACGADGIACSGALPGNGDEVRVSPNDAGQVVVQVGTSSATYALPAGAQLGNTCCAADCCQ